MPTMIPYGNICAQASVSISLDVASVAANTTAEQTFTLTGARAATDVVLAVNKPSLSAGLGVVNARISADDTLAITFANVTGSPIDPGAESYLVVIGRMDNTAALPALTF